MRWAVTGSGKLITQNNITQVQKLLNSRFPNTNNVVTISGTYLLPGDYYISLKLTNFLGKSSIAQVHVVVVPSAVPRVSIAGAKVNQMLRWQGLSLYAVASVPPCAANLGLALSYQWKVFSQLDNQLLAIESTSIDPRYFKAPPYIFDSLMTYVVKAIVTVPSFPSQRNVGCDYTSFSWSVRSRGIHKRWRRYHLQLHQLFYR